MGRLGSRRVKSGAKYCDHRKREVDVVFDGERPAQIQNEERSVILDLDAVPANFEHNALKIRRRWSRPRGHTTRRR